MEEYFDPINSNRSFVGLLRLLLTSRLGDAGKAVVVSVKRLARMAHLIARTGDGLCDQLRDIMECQCPHKVPQMLKLQVIYMLICYIIRSSFGM